MNLTGSYNNRLISLGANYSYGFDGLNAHVMGVLSCIFHHREVVKPGEVKMHKMP